MTAEKRSNSSGRSPRLTYEAFANLIAARVRVLLELADYLSRHPSPRDALTRPLLGQLLSQSSQLEELLDAYGAKNNRRWYPFRSTIATIKLFTDASYVLLHIQHAVPAYRLLPIKQDFSKATAEAIGFTSEVIVRALARLLEEARKVGLPAAQRSPRESLYAEVLPPGRLPSNRAKRDIQSASETVTYLASAFLNLAAESDLLHAPGRGRPEDYAACIPEPVSEEKLRHLQDRFHNLQSLYDTYVSETETEGLDADLPVLRGHITVIFHLLETATAFAHHYERHIAAVSTGTSAWKTPLVAPEALLCVLMEYSLAYASRYLLCAQSHCQDMLHRYAEVDRIEVPVPQYRGFHVRPSTLVAKVVRHYGSEVRMELGCECYDAGSPIDIFRANEKINAQKRRWLLTEVSELPFIADMNGTETDFSSLVRRAALTLAERSKLVIYEQPLPVREEPTENGGTMQEKVIEEISRLQATGKIDMDIDMKIAFVGDKRVLSDLKLLAESGYGEDSFGNNIPLPNELAYLRR
jgi:hypothetical protein